MAKFPDHPHYIPVIKWQKYEQHALSAVEQTIRPRMKPCIEVRTSKQHSNLLENLSKVWSAPSYVDYSGPEGTMSAPRRTELLEFLEYAIDNQIAVTPMLQLQPVATIGQDILKLASSLGSMSIRLRLESLSIPADKIHLVQETHQHLTDAAIPATFMIDLRVSPSDWTPAQVQSLVQDIRIVADCGYDSIHLISGAFPDSLAVIKTGSGTIRRSDWLFWRDVNRSAPDLLVGFGDYGTLSPLWSEETLVRRGGRASLRYTRESDWLILRADGNTSEDSIALSEILVNQYADDFKNVGYSFGDDLIADRADPAVPLRKKKNGNYRITEAWSHHIAYVLKEQY